LDENLRTSTGLQQQVSILVETFHPRGDEEVRQESHKALLEDLNEEAEKYD